MQLIIIFK